MGQKKINLKYENAKNLYVLNVKCKKEFAAVVCLIEAPHSKAFFLRRALLHLGRFCF
jgi:hypothetical protein